MTSARPRGRASSAKGERRARLPSGPGRYDRDKTQGERREEQRERLLAAATEVFAEKGYAGATVEAIVSRAGMSRRTFYEHFDDLGGVLLTLHDHAANLAYRLVEARVRAVEDPIEQLSAGVTAFLELIAAHGDLARVLFRELRGAGPQHAVRHEALLARFAALLFEGVARAHAAKIASRAPDELTVFALVAALEAVAMRYAERHEEARAPEAAPALTELVVRAFR